MKKWQVVVNRNGEMIDIGSVTASTEYEARCAALYKYTITKDELNDHVDTEDDLEVIGILEDDDFDVFRRG